MLARQQWRSLAVLVQFASGHDPTSIFRPAGTPAHSIFGLSMLVLGITGAIFLVVAGLLLYVLFRYRYRATGPEPFRQRSRPQHGGFCLVLDGYRLRMEH